MKPVTRSFSQRYGVALLTSLLAIGVTQETVLRTGMPYLLPIAAIVISAWYGGAGPGLVATVVGLLADMYFMLGPTIPLRSPAPYEAIWLSVFGLTALCIILLAVIRGRTEAHLREQSELLRVTLSSIGDAVVTTNEHGRIVFMNNVAQSLTGWKQEEVVGSALDDVVRIVYEDTDVPIEDPVARVIQENGVVALGNHSVLISKDGVRIPLDDSAAPIRDKKGRLVGIIMVFRDITERRHAEQAVQESEERYRAIAEAASDAIITIDENDQIVYVNQATERIFGYASEELIGRDLVVLMSDDQRDAHSVSLQRHVETGERHIPWDGRELVGLRKDGKTIPLEISLGKFVRNGEPYYTGVLRDISDRKQTEKRQAAQYAVTRALAESDTLRQAAPKILQAVCESMDWQVGMLWNVDRNVNVLRCVDVWHIPTVNIAEFETLSREMSFAPGVGLPGRAWADNRPSWISDVVRDPNFPRGRAAAKNNLHGAFGFPIESEGEITGVIEFFSQQVRPSDKQFLQMMTVLGSQIGQFQERKRAEEALKLSRGQQEIILQGVTDGIIAQDASGHIIYANQAAARMIGYSSTQELLKIPAAQLMQGYEVMDENGLPLLPEQLPGQVALRGGEIGATIIRFRSRNSDKEHWSLVSAAPVRNVAGEVKFAISIFRDVSDRMRVEQDVARLAAIVDSSEDAIISKTVDGVILTWNPAAELLYGYSAKEAIGKSIAMLYPPERTNEFREIRESLKRGESTPLHDTVRVTKDGRHIDVSVSVSLIKDSVGKVLGASTIARDITARKRAEEAQRFLADASRVLTSSLDYDETLTSVARLAVPRVADWCVIQILDEEGMLHEVALAHADPAKVRMAQELQRRYPADPSAPHGVHHVLRTGKTEFATDVSDAQITAAARDVEHLKMLLELGVRSYIIAPLIARGRTLGAITFVSSGHYGPADLALVEEMASRAALSVDNARLYHEARLLNDELEQRVVKRTIELQNANKSLEVEINERKQANEQLRLLSAHLQSAREEERIRIAREIHDELGQELTAIKIDMSLLGEQLEDKTAKMERDTWAGEIRSTIQLIDETIQKMRRIVRELRPEILDHLGLSAAIEWQMQEFQARTGIKCQFHSEIDDSRLDLNRSTAVFRILQEALTNVARHAGATSVEITLKEAGGRFILEIRDNGKGITSEELAGQKSFGILGMRERALAFGGEVDVSGAPNHGTVVMAKIPA